MKTDFNVDLNGIWSAAYKPSQELLSEFFEGDLCNADSCDALIQFINEPDDEAWSGEIGSVILEGNKIILESLWRDGCPYAEYEICIFIDQVKSWKQFLIENDLP